MKFVALVSGGKDSCYNILQCIKENHDLIAIANLCPPAQSDSDEMDSFMYQTVGYQAIDLYPTCLNVPLYRDYIVGKNAVTSLEYSPTPEDETEDLFRLLSKVKEAHPDLEGVSVGAILSTYQRVRVESVCQRLNLTSLAYLWQRDQGELLDEIISSGIDARLIKVAGLGLKKKHLGLSLSQAYSDIQNAHSMYGFHLCGEGGEYETLVFDAPIFSHSLEITSQYLHEDGDESYGTGTSFLTLSFKTVEKEVFLTPAKYREYVRAEHKLQKDAVGKFLQKVENLNLTGSTSVKTSSPPVRAYRIAHDHSHGPSIYVDKNRGEIWISNTCKAVKDSVDTPEDTVREMMNFIQKTLLSHKSSMDNILFSFLTVDSMDSFSLVNKEYGKYFCKPLPPSRACIGTGKVDISICARIPSEFAPASLGEKAGLHVQSWSYWAPANIGPYSQAIEYKPFIYLAGQIGLVPQSMTLEPDVWKQIRLSYKNLDHVRIEVGCEFVNMVVFVTSEQYVDDVRNFWTNADIPLIIVQVCELPKGGAVEWLAVGTRSLWHQQESDSLSENVWEENVNFEFKPTDIVDEESGKHILKKEFCSWLTWSNQLELEDLKSSLDSSDGCQFYTVFAVDDIDAIHTKHCATTVISALRIWDENKELTCAALGVGRKASSSMDPS